MTWQASAAARSAGVGVEKIGRGEKEGMKRERGGEEKSGQKG
jgi:hypothetical protein